MTPDDCEALTKSLEAAKEYADEILKPPLQQLGGLLSDTVGLWRLKNRVRVLLKAKKYLEDKGVKPAKLLPDVFAPLIDEAGNTEDETLSDMFARLLASHLDPAQSSRVHPAFAKVLAQLTPLDAHALQLIDAKDEHNWRNRKAPKAQVVLSDFGLIDNVRRNHDVTADAAQLSSANLERLGLCKLVDVGEDFADAPERDCRLTEFGRSLLSACAPGGAYWGDKCKPMEDLFRLFDGATDKAKNGTVIVRAEPMPQTDPRL